MIKHMAENSREIVLDVLLAMEQEKEYSSRLMKAVLDKYDYLDGKEKAFIKRVTEGTVERQLELDYYLDAFSSVPVRKMKPLIRCLLRMSVYQLIYMDTVPDSAVCNEACKLAGKRKFQNLRGFVNGVLRNIARAGENLPLPDREREPERFLSVKYSMPEWIVRLWMDEYGREITETLLRGLMQIHPVSLRFAGGLKEEERRSLLGGMEKCGAQLKQSPYLSYMYTLEKCPGVGSLPGFAEGSFTVQDASSALAVEAAGIQAGDFVLDVCAAPGGKTMLAAERAGSVLARDVSEEKTALIAENVARMGLKNVQVQVQDATVYTAEYAGRADVLLLDVPCSGLGVMGKKRDIKYRASREGLQSLSGLQRQILDTCWSYVKPGGTLVYSTCTIHAAENEEMVRYLTTQFPLEPLPLEGRLPEEVLALRSRLDTMRQESRRKPSVPLSEAEQAACIQLLPGVGETDGFFIACFRRREKEYEG